VKVKNVEALEKMGLALDPNDPTKAVPINVVVDAQEQASAKPNQPSEDSAQEQPGPMEAQPPKGNNDSEGDAPTPEVVPGAKPNQPSEDSAQEQPGPMEAEPPKGTEDGDSVPGDDGENARLTALFAKISRKLNEAARYAAASLGLGRKSVTNVFEAGQLLDEASGILKDEREWCEWQEKYDLPRSTCWEACELFRRAKTPEALEEFTSITQAKKHFGIYKPKKVKPTSKSESQNAVAAQIHVDQHHGNSDGRELEVARTKTMPTPDSNAGATPNTDAAVPVALPPPDPTFVLTETDEDALAVFVEAVGGFARVAQVVHAGWAKHQRQS
jgi:hypothetical protein